MLCLVSMPKEGTIFFMKLMPVYPLLLFDTNFLESTVGNLSNSKRARVSYRKNSSGRSPCFMLVLKSLSIWLRGRLGM